VPTDATSDRIGDLARTFIAEVDGRFVYEESIHVANCADDRAGTQSASPFGHGLGYTAWEYLDLTVPSRVIPTVRLW
jgi:beta-glucosidase